MAREKGYFSKSDFTKGFQCPKVLWMDAHMHEKFDKSLIDQARLDAGNEIGDMAMAYFGKFVEVKQSFQFDKMAAETAELIAEAARAIEHGEAFSVCEATFKYGHMVCMADIVRVRDAKTLDIIEVKSSTKLKEYHVNDLAYQTAVVQACGYDVASASVMHINSDYVLDGELDLQGFFAIEDMTDEAKARAHDVARTVADFMTYKTAEVEPEVEIGPQCNSPFACGYQTWCWRHVADADIFSLAGMGRTRALGRLNEGISSFGDAMAGIKLTALQRAQITAETGRGDTANIEELTKFLEGVTYPVYHLDFETVQPIVPRYQGTKPWQQVPTQFSVHKVEAPGASPKHAEFLAEHDADPRRAIAEALCATIPADACVTAYNMGFEKGRIRELADQFPDLADHLMGIHDGIIDLMVPFRSGWVYLKAMQGSYSIKKVLPALCPDDPDLDYAALEGVHNGTEAIIAFEQLDDADPAKRPEIREQLLRYCELDTLAMVKVHERLIEIAKHGVTKPI
ncbi:MAG: DUF2779 domain-containing protein [Eggerthellaceae bacterium]|nr:DUF2779 domain-containing protein [Eggerthellaceae bacterium]